MMPCLRLYAFLGQALAEKLDPQSPYHEWVDTYASDDMEVHTSRLEALFERYGGEPARLAWLYRRAMELEFAFFQSAWEAHDDAGRDG
jgi:thiaminase/transcriptional activator TenA